MTAERIQDSIEVAAPPEAVWAVVSDLRRMGEWSPQCRRMYVLGGDVRRGTRTFNLNRRGWLRWPTTSRVVVFEPEREVAFRIAQNRMIWTFALEPTATGTRVTESRTMPDGSGRASALLVQHLLGGTEEFEQELADGMASTLARIKTEVERAAS